MTRIDGVKTSADLEVHLKDSIDTADWNELVRQSSSNGIFQTTFFSDRLVELFDWKPVFLEVLDKGSGDIVGLLSAHVTNPRPVGSLANRVVSRVRRERPRLRWHGQPVILKGRDTSKVTEALLQGIRVLCDEFSLSGVDGSEVSDYVVVPEEWTVRNWATYHVDVSGSEEEAWLRLGKTARKAVRKADRQSISVARVKSLDELREYHSFAESVRNESGMTMMGFEDYETMWRHLRDPGIFETFAARIDGKLVAGLSVWGYDHVITELGAFVSQRSKDAKLNAGDALKWNIIKWACDDETKTYDLAGFNPNPVDEKERYIHRFKAKWNGDRIDYQYVSVESGG